MYGTELLNMIAVEWTRLSLEALCRAEYWKGIFYFSRKDHISIFFFDGWPSVLQRILKKVSSPKRLAVALESV